MNSRYRWYRIQLPSESEPLPSILARTLFGNAAAFGFQWLESTGTAVRFRFVSRVTVVVTHLDDTGTPAYEQVSSVSFTDFAVVSVDGSLFLRIENPPRNARDLLNAIESAVGFGFTCKLLVFEKTWPQLIFENVDSWKLVGLKAIDVVVGEDIVARIDFASTNGIDPEKLSILRGLRYRVDCSTYELFYHGLGGQLVVTAAGAVRIGGLLAPKVLNLIERELPRLAGTM
jgi:hypothetical protein